MKPVNLNQLLFHPKLPCLSFFREPLKNLKDDGDFDVFIEDMIAQLDLQEKPELKSILNKNRASIKKVVKSHPDRSHGFFISDKLQGYIVLDSKVDNYCTMGVSFHVRPLLEQLLVNPEFILVNISLYDIKVFRADFHRVDIIKAYEFDELPNTLDIQRFFSPASNGLIPYRSVLAIRTIAQKVMEITLYQKIPVIVTGLEDMKKIFLRNFHHTSGVLSHFDEDFYEKTCMEIFEKSRVFHPAVMDYYSALLKERLKKMIKSRRLVSDVEHIIKAAGAGNIIHLVLPVEKKVWGRVDFESGVFEIHKKLQTKNPSVDILNELAEEVMKSGGKIQFLGPHFFPENSFVLAIVKGSL